MQFPLPQKQPISASSFTDARKKLSESIFIEVNQRIIKACPEKASDLWMGHRLFGIDGLEAEPAVQVNFKNTLTVFARRLEEMLYAPWIYINQIMTGVICEISRFYHKKKRGTSFSKRIKTADWQMEFAEE